MRWEMGVHESACWKPALMELVATGHICPFDVIE